MAEFEAGHVWETSAEVDVLEGVVNEPVDVVEDEGSAELEESEWLSLKLAMSEETSAEIDASAAFCDDPVNDALKQSSEEKKDLEDNARVIRSSQILPNQTLGQSTQTLGFRNAKADQVLEGIGSDLTDTESPLGELRFKDD